MFEFDNTKSSINSLKPSLKMESSDVKIQHFHKDHNKSCLPPPPPPPPGVLVNRGPNIQCRVGMMQDERKFKGGMWDGQELAGSRKFVCLILARWEQLRL